jgi:hypothetical protein
MNCVAEIREPPSVTFSRILRRAILYRCDCCPYVQWGALDFRSQLYRSESSMAKGQQRGNREIRKPKAPKPAVAPAASPFGAKGSSAAASPPKRKG